MSIDFTFAGKLVDIGDLDDGCGIVLAVGDRTITVTGLAMHEVRALAQCFGETLGLRIQRAEKETPAAPMTRPCSRCGKPLECTTPQNDRSDRRLL